MAERAGPGGEGDVIDHFSGKAITKYLSHFDSIFKNYEIDICVAISMILTRLMMHQDRQTGHIFCSRVLRQKGLRPPSYLPALFQKDTPETNSRVLSDYRQTISDLILEKFTAAGPLGKQAGENNTKPVARITRKYP